MTVSRVLSGYPGVRAETRARVEEAIELLGYRVHTAARTLAGGSSGIIGVISVASSHFGPSSTVFSIAAAARESGLSTSVAILPNVSESSLRQAIDHLKATHVQGIVVNAFVQAAVEALGRVETDLPLVVLCGGHAVGHPSVAVDQKAGSRLATRHLLELGHDTVHHVRGPVGWIDAGGRASGWRDELRRWGRKPPPAMIGDWSPRSGYLAGQQIVADPSITAVFVANDHMALGVLRALNEAGRSVGRDVSVVGFDDIPESAYSIPPLTTIQQDFDLVGREGLSLLLRSMNGEVGDEHITVEPQILLRRSTGTRRPAAET
jgi:DNA-binding LacI/PurR family transcriptional regulator